MMTGEFNKKLNDVLKDIDPSVFNYRKDEFWMVESIYEYIEQYAKEHELLNTSIALPLIRGLHNGAYRKLTITRDGETYRLPYLIHPLLVTRMLVDMHINLTKDEEDILYAAALCHDLLEDVKFKEGGKELVEKYHLDPEVLEIIKLMTKRYDFTPEEEVQFFKNIGDNKFSALIKLSDRGNNVEDLYNMSVWKVHEYIDETNKFFIPIAISAKRKFKEYYISFDILEDKIVSLTTLAETLVDRYDAEEKNLRKTLENLRSENKELHTELETLIKKEGISHE